MHKQFTMIYKICKLFVIVFRIDKHICLSILFIILCSYATFSQTTKIDNVISEIQFKNDTIQAVFEWVANNIEYDTEQLRFNRTIRSFSFQSDEEKVKKTLLTKKGICEDYALVFNNLCRKLGYESYLVGGYTKDLTKIEIREGHAWNVIKIKGKWYCFDPTWSAGGINQNIFYKKFNDSWFKVPPNEFIYTHVPYDPIWQLTEHPVIAKTNNINLPINDYFSFEDSISTYSDSKSIKFQQNLINRIVKYSDTNDNVKQYVKFLKEDLNSNKYNIGIEKLNNAVNIFNSYVFCKNNGFRKPKLKDIEIKDILDSVKKNINESKNIFESLELSNLTEKTNILLQINEMSKKLDEEFIFFRKYMKLKSPFKQFDFK